VAAIAVLEPPYRELQNDLSVGGRWFWPDSFSSDIDTATEAVERVWGYLLRHFPLDSERVCLAGEGTGAAVAATVTMLTNRLDVRSIAWAPRRYAKTKDIPLPLPELRGNDRPPVKSLQVFGQVHDEEWWASELKAYNEIGLESRLIRVTDDPWQREAQLESALRDALGLDRRIVTAAGQRRYILPAIDSPRARHWARLHAIWAGQQGGQVAAVETLPTDVTAVGISTELRPKSFSDAKALPRCPGPFGGTTVLVLGPQTSIADQEAWLALAQDDPLAKASRFHRLRVAMADGERDLGAVLNELSSANRKNVLIVPATFCADSVWMQAMRRSVRQLQDQMTLQWLPGLGGRKAALSIGDATASAE
jgi:hypothetical protein